MNPCARLFPYEEVKCFALNKLQTTGKRTACSEENNMNCRRVPLCKIARMTKRIPHAIHKKSRGWLHIFSEEYTVCCTGEHSPQVRSNKPTSYNSLLCCRCPLHPVHTCESAPLPVLTRRSGPLLRYAEALQAAPHRAPLPQHFRDLH